MRITILNLVFIFMSVSHIYADTKKLDDIAACAGVIMGNAAVDLLSDDEQSFDAASQVAYAAYFSQVFSVEYKPEEVQFSDTIFLGNINKITTLANSGDYDSDVYNEVIDCYQKISLHIIEKSKVIIEYEDKWRELQTTNTENLKRFLLAG